MKNYFSAKSLFVLLLLTLLPAARAGGAQEPSDASSTPKQLTLTFELQDLPGRAAPGSTWEVFYQWRIADQKDFDRRVGVAEGATAATGLGVLLSKQSFTRRNLSAPENRRFSVSVPVSGELLERLRRAGQRPQIVWLDATVRIRDAKLGMDVIKKVNPVWGPAFYREGAASLRMELTPEGKLRWFTTTTPPWAGGQRPGAKIRSPLP